MIRIGLIGTGWSLKVRYKTDVSRETALFDAAVIQDPVRREERIEKKPEVRSSSGYRL